MGERNKTQRIVTSQDRVDWSDVSLPDGRIPAPWPTIVLPGEKRVQLTAKLAEYKARMQEGDRQFQHPDLQLLMGSDAASKAVILERLLRDGRVNTRELMGELRDRLGDMYNPLTLVVPILVINDYCESGGKNTGGGTGLPKIKKPPRTPKSH